MIRPINVPEDALYDVTHNVWSTTEMRGKFECIRSFDKNGDYLGVTHIRVPSVLSYEQIVILKDEALRGTLTSMPLQMRFMRDRGFKDHKEVLEWMSNARRRYMKLVSTLAF